MKVSSLVQFQRSLLVSIFLFLTACGGSSTGQSPAQPDAVSSPQFFIAGGGVKGPLAFASVELYTLDKRYNELYHPNNPIAAATTDTFAQITSLPVPADTQPPYILVIDGTNAIDLNTGVAPVIKKLVTVITRESLESRLSIYATPYTTLAYHMLRFDSLTVGKDIQQTISFEAENYTNTQSQQGVSWNEVTRQGASGNAAMQAPYLPTEIATINEGYSASSPRLDYSVSIDKPGQYYAWVRVIGAAANANSLHIGLDYDENPSSEHLKFPVNANWSWQGGPGRATIDINGAGIHTLNIWVRESGTVVDKVILTANPNYVPSGTGASESKIAASASIDETLAEFNTQIIDSISFGMPAASDVFRTPPVITQSTTTVEEQRLVVHYRAAIEALSSLLYEMSLSSPGVSTDVLLQRLADDLYSDGVIDNSDGVQTIGGIDTNILSLNPMTVAIANTRYLVQDTVELIDEERALAGNSSNILFYKDNISVNLQAAQLTTGAASPPVSAIIDNAPAVSYSSRVVGIKETVLSAGLIASGPIVINGEQGVVISGLRISNPNGNCIDIKNGASNIVIENSEIGPCGKKGIYILQSANVDVRNNYIHDAVQEGIMSYQSNDIAVDSNIIENIESGYEMWTTSVGNLSFTRNYVKNLVRNTANKNGGNMVQIAFVKAGGIRVTDNISINVSGESEPEDLVNVYKSRGTAEDPIRVSRNLFKGGGPGLSSGGIILGDQGGSYQIAEDNILVNPGQYGLQMGGGSNLTFRNNKVYSDDQRSFTNVGLIIWRYNDSQDVGTLPGNCNNLTVENNEITWWKGPNYKNSGSIANLDPYYNPSFGSDNIKPNCGAVAGWGTNKFDTQNAQPANLNMSIWNSAWDNP